MDLSCTYDHLRYEEMATKYNVEYIAGGNALDSTLKLRN